MDGRERSLQSKAGEEDSSEKKKKRSRSRDRFQSLPDDLVIAIFICVSSTAASPADLANAALTCRRFWSVASHPGVLARACGGSLAVRASRWSDGAHRFLKRCSDAGNAEACYTLGIIRFYCLGNRSGGASLMARAAMASHAGALHSLAVIQFNGSGGSKKDKDLTAGVALCARAASLGHVDAMRDLGHCLQDGYGVPRNVAEGRRMLIEANAREAAAAGLSLPRATSDGECGLHKRRFRLPLQKMELDVFCLLSDFGCNVPPAEPHIANRFLIDWFGLHRPPPALRLCSFLNCGRPETRRHEFRRCSACGFVNYCSRACQALDWKMRHRYDCTPSADWEENLQDSDNDDEYFHNFGGQDDASS